jgi:putative heme-binding domain-containing protein
VVEQQAAVPRGKLGILAQRLEDEGRLLVLETHPHPLPVTYVLALRNLRSADQPGSQGEEMELEYDLTEGCRSFALGIVPASRHLATQPVPWAPPAKASSGTTSQPAGKPDGDWENGRELFVGKLQCAKCHRIHGQGGHAGPDLSNLIHRDLNSILRDIREPSAGLHPEYVTHLAETRSGQSHAGFLRPSPNPDEVVLADVEGREQRWPRAELLRLAPTGGSLMPTGLLDDLTAGQIRDLLTFLSWTQPNRTREEISRLPQLPKPAEGERPIRLILVASKQDHGPGQHDYPAWQTKWMRLLGRAARKTVVEKAWEWPAAEQWTQADAVVFYTWNHDWSPARYADLDAFQARGGGVIVLHSAVIADTDPQPLAERLGLSAHPGISYRHMPFELELSQEASPLTRGLPAKMRFLDEPFYRLLVLRGIAWAAGSDPDALIDLTALETNSE